MSKVSIIVPVYNEEKYGNLDNVDITLLESKCGMNVVDEYLMFLSTKGEVKIGYTLMKQLKFIIKNVNKLIFMLKLNRSIFSKGKSGSYEEE